ncbi:MAG: hypothetical protein FWD97_06885 [Defluviitaleaceae bacterium]|nr:hypothetical protein [Defluviitaleaceae bacterium]
MSSKGKLTILAISLGVLLVSTVVLGIFFVVSFINNTLGVDRERLETGDIVTIQQAGTFHIYVEDSIPPPSTVRNHQFSFSNTVTEAVTHSRPPSVNSTYSLNTLTIGGNVVRGTFGQRVATVDLTESSYLIHIYPYWLSSGEFVWGFDLASGIFALIFQTSLLSFAFIVIVTLFIIALVRLFKIKKQTGN